MHILVAAFVNFSIMRTSLSVCLILCLSICPSIQLSINLSAYICVALAVCAIQQVQCNVLFTDMPALW